MQLTISQIKLFKACRQAYRLKYIERLEPVKKAEALEIGTNYHAMIEDLNNGKHPEGTSKEAAMATAYQKYIFPHFHVTASEQVFEKEFWVECTLKGIVDGIADDGHIVEHKTTSAEITEEYEFNLQWDEQILAYMFLTGRRKVWYTICRKPTIRQKQNETDEQFFERMVAWYDEGTESKIRLLEIQRTDAEVEQFKQNLISIAIEMNVASNQSKNTCSCIADPYYRNTCHCQHWGRRCEYASICLNYDPDQNYIEFQKWDADR